MNRLYKYILIMAMVTFAFIQVFYINKSYKEKNVKVYNNSQNIVYNHKTLKELNKELNCLKEKNILSANRIKGKWYIKLKIQGNKDDLLSEVSKLENYDISDCIINKNKDENEIILEICTKESV